ncbi:MAG: fatty acid hydroxylase [Alcanivorax sp.]|nr:fatty acid hydroxylase [Alcanivorax sp.]MAL94377.1 fatty acid hydroxylase [Haliea sp.]|tara:strand:+ start:1036 stop:1890 length:855 start_codon:yes stop_codon:yes gene_type:complete
MSFTKVLFRYGTWPMLFFGFGGAVVWLASANVGVWPMFAVLAGAVAFSFFAERVIPYQPDWNRTHGDVARDWLHALVNTTLNRAALWLLPWLTWTALGGGFWPHTWPFALQVVFAALILDLGIAMAHHASHRFALLWRFHAVHHSPKRLYGFNGLMKHPVHQAIETSSGVLPLLLLGIPFEVAITLPFLVTIALLCQHSNADYRTGWFKYVFANAEVHRFHHANSADGDVNFGLFTVLYDRMMGTFRYEPDAAPRESRQIGIAGEQPYPVNYWAQLAEPFRPSQ